MFRWSWYLGGLGRACHCRSCSFETGWLAADASRKPGLNVNDVLGRLLQSSQAELLIGMIENPYDTVGLASL